VGVWLRGGLCLGRDVGLGGLVGGGWWRGWAAEGGSVGVVAVMGGLVEGAAGAAWAGAGGWRPWW